MKYTVYFNQVNQSRYEVEAKTPFIALGKAKKLWWDDNPNPPGPYIENEKGDWVFSDSDKLTLKGQKNGKVQSR